MGEDLLRVSIGAVSVYRMRLTDVHLRELVMHLWIVEGESHMRCHSGNSYFFNYGAFALHQGVPPQAMLARCKRFCLRLEGLFRLMNSALLDRDCHVLDNIRELLGNYNGSERDLLYACEDAASGCIPQRWQSAAAPGEDADGVPAHAEGRPQRTADALSQAGWAMEQKLIDDKIFNLVVSHQLELQGFPIKIARCSMIKPPSACMRNYTRQPCQATVLLVVVHMA